MKKNIKIGIVNLLGICLLCFAIPIQAIAQDDFFRQTGKINNVFGIIMIILVCLFAYLIRLEYKITKLEKQFKDEQ